jgi:DNA repair exonuclease SbcCD nuclease subunit
MLVGGDVHGNFKYLLTLISGYNFRDSNIVICGDCGFGFEEHKKEVATVKYLNQSFVARNNQLYLCRGNHDDPKYWSEEDNLSDKNIHFVPDYSVLQIENNNVLFLGGAISVDRVERKINRSYWEKEPFILDLEKLNSMRNIDIVISHSSPNYCYPYGLKGMSWFDRDTTLQQEVMKERNDLARAYDKLSKNNKIKYWFYGHFHEYKREVIKETIFVLSECNVLNEYNI